MATSSQSLTTAVSLYQGGTSAVAAIEENTRVIFSGGVGVLRSRLRMSLFSIKTILRQSIMRSLSLEAYFSLVLALTRNSSLLSRQSLICTDLFLGKVLKILS